jgi:predicted nucleic acid-binding protein
LVELDRVLSKKFGLPPPVVQGFLDLINEEVERLVVANENLPKIPDPDDVEILAYGSGGQADIFITGDKALLGLKAKGDMLILSPRECWDKLKAFG